MADAFTIETLLPASPEDVYFAWLDGESHADMTGTAGATCDPRVGGAFTAWDGYIEGKNLELIDGRRIVQSWRTSDFAEGDPDSRLEIDLHPHHDGTRIVLKHTGLPNGEGPRYEDGWNDFYFEPMREYFES
jgi:uncharacterized protein YndB with AHSA1/START domain